MTAEETLVLTKMAARYSEAESGHSFTARGIARFVGSEIKANQVLESLKDRDLVAKTQDGWHATFLGKKAVEPETLGGSQ